MATDDDLAELIEVSDPETAFERLAHEHRLGAILALAEADGLGFEELRRTVGATDPGGFNYHLQRLRGLFIEKDDDQYQLTPAGHRVVGAVVSGAFSSDFTGDTMDTEGTCLNCDAGLVLELDRAGVSLRCESCDIRYNQLEVPPRAIAGHEADSIYRLVDRWVKRWLTTASYGFCPRCDGPMDRRVLVTDDPADWPGQIPAWVDDLPIEAVLRFGCQRCEEERYAHVASAAALHPVIMAEHIDHGIDIRTEPLFELDWLGLDVTTVVSREPLRVRVPVSLDEKAIDATFDREFSLVEAGPASETTQ